MPLYITEVSGQTALGVRDPLITDSSGHAQIFPTAGSSLAINDASSQTQHLAINSAGAASLNLTQLSGTAVGLTNPFVFQDQLRAYAINAQMYSATTGLQTSAGAVTTAMSLFNPNGSGKSIIVVSIHIATAAGAQHKINSVTVDPAYANSITSTNNKLGGAASVASATYLNAAASNTGTTIATTGTGGNTVTEALQNGAVYVLPANNGIIVFVTTSTNAWQVTAQWIEV